MFAQIPYSSNFPGANREIGLSFLGLPQDIVFVSEQTRCGVFAAHPGFPLLARYYLPMGATLLHLSGPSALRATELYTIRCGFVCELLPRNHLSTAAVPGSPYLGQPVRLGFLALAGYESVRHPMMVVTG